MPDTFARSTFNAGSLQDRVAVVTGAQQGIGACIAEAYAAVGARVVVNYLDDAAAAEAIRGRIEASGGVAMAFRGDVSKVQDITAMVDATVQRFGRVDILVNNAAVYPRSPALDLSEAEWDRVIDVNLKGTFFCAQAAARRMCQQGGVGAIVNMSSITIRGSVNGAHYTATKGGVASLTRTLALEWAQHGIRVNAIAPGLIDTAQPRIAWSEAQVRERGRATPLGRIGRVDDIADTAIYLASDASAYMTGQILHVNGGSFLF